MDPKLFKLARQLQAKLSRIDDQTDRDAFESLHGLLIELIACLETAMPGLRVRRLAAQAKANREEAARILKEMRLEANQSDDTDSLEQIEREMGEEDPDFPVGVPANRKPGPKGLTGGVALPLPDSEV